MVAARPTRRNSNLDAAGRLADSSDPNPNAATPPRRDINLSH
jgi:hypothetical protein